MWLLKTIIESYSVTRERERERTSVEPRKGIPIGNLTSQLFANIYMNEFDQWMKHMQHIRHYARYTDDFAIVSSDPVYLENLIMPISRFLHDHLSLTLHPKKVFLRTFHHGVDFLGYVIFPHHRLVRAKTRRRMFAQFKIKIAAFRAGAVSKDSLAASLRSYLGVFSHADAIQRAEEIKNLVWFLD